MTFEKNHLPKLAASWGGTDRANPGFVASKVRDEARNIAHPGAFQPLRLNYRDQVEDSESKPRCRAKTRLRHLKESTEPKVPDRPVWKASSPDASSTLRGPSPPTISN